MIYRITLEQSTPVVDSTAADFCGTLMAGVYEAILIDNPFKNDDHKLKPWIAIQGKEHLGQCKEAWEGFPWVRIEEIKQAAPVY